MDPARPTTPRTENLIQGPRPAPLRVSKDSFKIKKPPRAPAPQLLPLAMAPPGNQPVIIYSVSPEPIFVEASDFRSLVQHLTGRDPPVPEDVASVGKFWEPPVSPAARFAALERTSPKERDWRRGGAVADDGDVGVSMVGEAEVDVFSQMPGILSPAPSNLPVISPGMFSPVPDGQNFFGVSELMSPFMSNTAFLPSPSGLFFGNTSIVSPSPKGDYFKLFDF